MKTTRHSLMAKGIMVLLSLLVLIFAFSYSWYIVSSTEVSASGISGRVEATGDFEYAIGFYNNGTGGAYKVTPFTSDTTALNLEDLEATDGQSYNLLHDYKPIDVTGDGRTLIRPSMSYGNSQINTASLDYSDAEPNVQYISFDLYFRSEVAGLPIKLGSSSWAKGAAEVNNLGLTGSSEAAAFNKSTYGNFSKDAIVGAVRVAFVPYLYTTSLGNIPANLAAYQKNTPDYLSDTASFVWLPRTDLHLNEPSGGGVTGWTLTTNSTDTADAAHQYYNIFECQPAKADGYPSSDSTNYHKTATYSNTVTPAVLQSANQQFTDITQSVKFGDYYYTKVNVRIWIEGTDTESRRAVSGGKFEINFQFTTN